MTGHPARIGKWWSLAVVVTAIFMLLIDITVVNVALPEIERSLDAGFTDLQWIIDAYALALATFVLTAGALSDLLGRRRMFGWGLAIFTTASLACGFATGPEFLIVSRAVQGIGGAVMFATSLAIISQSYTGSDRGIAFGVWGAVAGAAVAVGPLIGGVLTTGISWRWIFFVNAPIGLAALVASRRLLAESRDPAASRVDWAGLVTLCAGICLGVYTLLRGNAVGWSSPRTLGFAACAVFLLLLFVLVEARQDRSMVDLRLFGRPAFVGVQATAFLLSLSFFGLFLYITLYLQNILGYSALQAGLRVIPISVTSFLIAPFAGRLSARLPVRLFLGGGMTLIGAGLLLMTRVHTGADWTVLVPGFVLAGLGLGLTNPPLASSAVAVAPRERSGMASGINNTFRQLGIATGVAALGAVFTAHITSSLRGSLDGTPLAAHAADLGQAISSGSFTSVADRLPPAAREPFTRAAGQAFVSSLRELFWIGAVVAFVSAAIAFITVRRADFVSAGPVPDTGRPDMPPYSASREILSGEILSEEAGGMTPDAGGTGVPGASPRMD